MPRPASLSLALAALLAGCQRAPTHTAADAPPRAEFLLSAGDSTYWVTSDAAGVRVRSSPMLLARYGGRFYEVYAADDDRSYYDAIFISQRIYRRDLLDGDSLPVFDDSTVPALARHYAASHPHELRLGPDDESASDPRTTAMTEVSLVDVHGPFLTYDARADIDDVDGIVRHTSRRAVVDLRTARPTTLADLFGAAAADSLAVSGRRALGRALDSVRALADSGDEAGARALHALPSFRFAADNFGLGADGERPAVVFVSLGRDMDDRTVTLPLPPITVPGVVPAWWSDEVRDALPATSRDSVESHWTLRTADAPEVVARYSSSRETVALALREGAAARRRGRPREWPLVRVSAPARQLYVLDRTLDPESRRALARAFNESALYGGDVTSASYHPSRARRRASLARRVRR